jgi:hypothetical protein
MSIALQAKQTCIIIENIWKLAKATRVDIRTFRSGLGPPGNTSHDLQNNMIYTHNHKFYLASPAHLHNYWKFWNPDRLTAIDIQTLGNESGPPQNTSHDVSNDYDSENNSQYYIAIQAHLHNYWKHLRTGLTDRHWHLNYWEWPPPTNCSNDVQHKFNRQIM